jgi:proteasome assembly chaperone (PAC2) family protein
MKTIIVNQSPSLIRPVLIVAFGGWGDAGRAATLAMQHLVATWSAAKFADVDPDELYDFTSSRPRVHLDRDGQRQITWPGTSFFAHQDPAGGTDAILVLGPEPAYHWKAFTAEVVELARRFDVRMVVTLGAFPAQISHRDSVPLTGWASPPDLDAKLKALDVSPVAYEGPTNLNTVLGVAVAEAKIPIVALWAAVPAFLGATANPKGAHALVKTLDKTLGLGLDLAKLKEASQEFERTVNRAIRRVNAPPGTAIVPVSGEPTPAEKTEPTPAEPDEIPSELPSADELVRTAEEFLRKNRGG